MPSLKKISFLGAIFALLSSCTCGVPLKVTPIQRSDKKLTCKDVILEINESEHYRTHGRSEKGIGLGELLMPVCWVSGFIDGGQAAKRANDRIDYLGNIYDLMDCGGSDPEPPRPRPAPPPPPPVVVPVQPAPQPLVEKDSHYRLDNSNRESRLHEHKDKRSKLYIHNHPHKGPHRHLEDE